MALQGLASACAALGDVDGAIGHLRQLIRRVPEPLPLIGELAKFCQQHGRLEVALEAYQRYLQRHPDSAVGHHDYAYYAARLGRGQLALDHYARALQLGIDRPEEVHLNMANVLTDLLRDDAAARRHLERALALRPDYPGALFNLGNLSEQEGALEAARRYFERCLEVDPGRLQALARLADTHDFSAGNDALFARLEEAGRGSDDPDLHIALGRAREQRGDFAGAWHDYTRANEADRKAFPAYDRAQWERRIERIISTCTPQWLARLTQERDQAPVFICGLFRSGSTLIEQVLAAHPAFTPAGEREFFPRLVAGRLPRYPDGLEKVAAAEVRNWARTYVKESVAVFGSAARLTDKRPDNFLFLGLIKAMFPRSKVVISRRDWRDAAVSMYATRLGPNAAYATDLGDIRHFVGLHDRLVAHWRALFGDDLVEVQYEELIADPRQSIGRLLEALAEPWDERCLRFHEVGNTVRTASVWQVRQPLNAGSVGRWRRFHDHFVAAFGDGN